MRRVLSIAVLVLGGLCWSVQPAYADLWDWLQEFSGPGPFHTDVFNLMADVCGQKKTTIAILNDGKSPTIKRVTSHRFLRDFETPGQETVIERVTAPSSGVGTFSSAYPYMQFPNGYRYLFLPGPTPDSPGPRLDLQRGAVLMLLDTEYPNRGEAQKPSPLTGAVTLPLPLVFWTTDGKAVPIPQKAFDALYGPNARPRHSVCVFADYRRFSNDDQDLESQKPEAERTTDNFGAGVIKIRTAEAGISTRLHRAIVLGFGGGFMQIHSLRTDTTTYKPILTGPRVVIRPFLLYGSDDFWNRHPNWYYAAGAVKYYFKENIVLARLQGSDFGVADDRFSARWDRVASTGFVWDVTDVVVAAFSRLTRSDIQIR